ncbi:hypothetical protein SFRURICE_003528 [Spodoptera frugiperda]|nr:hypothetical protein SFRURICE_003528 [Spodoptera frugiperda]
MAAIRVSQWKQTQLSYGDYMVITACYGCVLLMAFLLLIYRILELRIILAHVHGLVDVVRYVAVDAFGFRYAICIGTHCLALVETDSADLIKMRAMDACYGWELWMCAIVGFPTIDTSHIRIGHLPRTATLLSTGVNGHKVSQLS